MIQRQNLSVVVNLVESPSYVSLGTGAPSHQDFLKSVMEALLHKYNINVK